MCIYYEKVVQFFCHFRFDRICAFCFCVLFLFLSRDVMLSTRAIVGGDYAHCKWVGFICVCVSCWASCHTDPIGVWPEMLRTERRTAQGVIQLNN